MQHGLEWKFDKSGFGLIHELNNKILGCWEEPRVEWKYDKYRNDLIEKIINAALIWMKNLIIVGLLLSIRGN